MSWWQTIWQHAQLPFPFRETAVRSQRTLYFKVWPTAAPAPPRPRWSAEALQQPHPTASAALQAYLNPASQPPPRASLTLLQAYIIATSCFANTGYDVYLAGGHTEWLKPLVSTDAVVVFERLDALTLIQQPLNAGDMVLFEWQGQTVLHRLAALESTAVEFTTTGGLTIPIRHIASRLAAVFYTRTPAALEHVPPAQGFERPVWVDAWPPTLFEPLVPTNKPTPHSAISMDNNETRINWLLLRRLLRDYNGDVWRTIANTNSMEPFVDANTALLFERVAQPNVVHQPLIVGDIVNWGTPQFGRLHRIIGRGPETTFYIKGDNNPTVDQLLGREPIHTAEIRHRVVGIIYTRQQADGD